MKNGAKGLVRRSSRNGYQTTFRYVRDVELRLSDETSERASELIECAYGALDRSLHEASRPRKSTLYLAARMAAGLALRELSRSDVTTAA